MRAYFLLLLAFGTFGEPAVDPVPAVENETAPKSEAVEKEPARSALSDSSNPLEQAILLSLMMGGQEGQQRRTDRRNDRGGDNDDALNMLLMMSLLKGGQSTVSKQGDTARSLVNENPPHSPLLQQLALHSMLGGQQAQSQQTCQGVCGRSMPKRDCGCDFKCETQGDCCPDYHTLCSVVRPEPLPQQQPVYLVPQVTPQIMSLPPVMPPQTFYPPITGPLITPALNPSVPLFPTQPLTPIPSAPTSTVPVPTVTSMPPPIFTTPPVSLPPAPTSTPLPPANTPQPSIPFTQDSFSLAHPMQTPLSPSQTSVPPAQTPVSPLQVPQPTFSPVPLPPQQVPPPIVDQPTTHALPLEGVRLNMSNIPVPYTVPQENATAIVQQVPVLLNKKRRHPRENTTAPLQAFEAVPSSIQS